MAANLVDFPNETCFKELISSFPREWQGLFAALNVEESQAVMLGTQWFRDKAFSPRKGHISPHWPDLIRALTLSFPVIFNTEVVFWPKFACLTLKLQRNLLLFIVFHSESIPEDDMEFFLAMLFELPQKYQWLSVLTNVLQRKTKLMRLKKEWNLESSVSGRKLTDSKREGQVTELSSESYASDKIVIHDWPISKAVTPRLKNLCTTLKSTSFPGSTLLASNVKLAGCYGNTDGNPQCEMDKQSEAMVMDIDAPADDEIKSSDNQEVIEILDSSPEVLPGVPTSELPNPPDLSHLPEITDTVDMDVDVLEKYMIPEKVTQFKEYLGSEEFEEEQFFLFVGIFLEFPPKDLERFCQFMEMATIPEMATVILIQQFLSLNEECSFQGSVVFAEYCIGSKLQTLQQAASRNLLAAVNTFAKMHSKAFVDGVMVKCFESKSMQWPQCDVMLKVIKDTLDKDILKYFLGRVLMPQKSTLSSTWDDHIISIFAVIIDMKLELDWSIFDKFVTELQLQSLGLANNLKFAKLVLTMINKYGPMVKQSSSAFQQILEENNTFLKKSALTVLKKVSR